MNDTITVTGLVISASPMGEFDKRLLLLTRHLGKISAFAKGARRPNSPLIGAATLFAFGEFELHEGRSAYTVRSARITEHFDYLTPDMEGLCYGSYFGEFADYYGQEGVDESRLLLCVYLALRALRLPERSRPLIRAIFELKVMQVEGEYYPEPPAAVGEEAARAWHYVLEAPGEKLFSLKLTEEGFRDFRRAVEDQKEHFIDRRFRSLEVLREMEELSALTREKSNSFRENS